MKKKILVVARWPLGGIRTYMKYMFKHLSKTYTINLIAGSTHENDALMNDVRSWHGKYVIVNNAKILSFSYNIILEIKKTKYDLIISQGYLSAVSVYFANILFSRS